MNQTARPRRAELCEIAMKTNETTNDASNLSPTPGQSGRFVPTGEATAIIPVLDGKVSPITVIGTPEDPRRV